VQITNTAVEVLRSAPLAKTASFDELLHLVSECAIGDYLDGLDDVPVGPGDAEHTVFCPSGRAEELLKRPPAAEGVVTQYLASKTYWSKKLQGLPASFLLADAKRLGQTMRGLRYVADMHLDEYWKASGDAQPDRFSLKPTQLLQQRGPRLVGPSVTGPLFDISDFLVGARFRASAQQFKKAVAFLNEERPDYENAIKEAVGAVESRARQMTGEATLGRASDELARCGLVPRSLAKLQTALNDYRNSMPAVGHGGVEPADTEALEARAMVNSCAAALLYLLGLEPEA
jgi:hypothetical protein